jgi:hypothetical protein
MMLKGAKGLDFDRTNWKSFTTDICSTKEQKERRRRRGGGRIHYFVYETEWCR